MNNIVKPNYNNLKDEIKKLLLTSRKKAYKSVNTILVGTYWQIGRYIVEFEQHGENKATYGRELLVKLSKELTIEYGKGFSRSSLTYMRKLYIAFPKSETLFHKLSWSHYFELLKTDDKLEMGFYLK